MTRPDAFPAHGMRHLRWTLLLLLALASAPARAEDSKNVVKDTIKESAKTGGHAVRDGALTFGRSTRAFFKHGPKAAKRTWKANAQATKQHAKDGGRRTRAAAHEE